MSTTTKENAPAALAELAASLRRTQPLAGGLLALGDELPVLYDVEGDDTAEGKRAELRDLLTAAAGPVRRCWPVTRPTGALPGPCPWRARR
jgi:hypothetical protein